MGHWTKTKHIISRKIKAKDTKKWAYIWYNWPGNKYDGIWLIILICPWPGTEVCRAGVDDGQPGHYAITLCPGSLTVATGSPHSPVLIAASHSHTFTDHTNQTFFNNFVLCFRFRHQSKVITLLFWAKYLWIGTLEWSICNYTVGKHGHYFPWFYLQHFPSCFYWWPVMSWLLGTEGLGPVSDHLSHQRRL